ncbi:MAG: HDIG domain-containing protein [Anaerolineae bacterium]|nr:HDIG domain-containing protein [Anaerolineae bacterium]MDW8069424.1 HDIG domain-containing protein [Anaerolineae bacterium]
MKRTFLGEQPWWFWVRLAVLAFLLVIASTFFLSVPLLPSGRVVLEVGDVAPQDIRAPRRITYESAIRTAEQQQQAEAAVPPVYTAPDPNLARQQLERARQVLDYLGAVRADPFATPAQRRAWTLAVPELQGLPPAVADLLPALSDESWNRVQLEVLNVIAETMRRGVREDDLDSARRQAAERVGLDLSADEAAVTTALAQRLIVPNSFYDEEATRQARQAAREAVPPVVRTLEANEIIVREGQRVSALDLEALQELGLQQSRTRWTELAGNGVLSILSVLMLGGLLARFQPDVLREGRKALLLVLLILLFLALARLMVPDRTVLRYMFPAPALAMLATGTLGAPAGLVAGIFIGGVAGLLADRSLEFLTAGALGSIAATLAVRQSDRPAVFFRAGMMVALTMLATMVAFALFAPHPDLLSLGLAMAGTIANGLTSASLALAGLFLLGPLFDLPTTFRLLELSRPDQPLLQRLLREAPGTYHHSLMVASMAEQAAEQIGLNPLLVRVGAYYHDVGKIARPYFFAENQLEGTNPHDRLDPHTSAQVIIGHVQDGLELARRYHLPAWIRAFIAEHHGTSRAGFQYERALEHAGNPAWVNEADFRHRGPRPRSRETALVMLADRCEATVRARRPTTPEELVGVVEEVFAQALRTGQLDECPITMEELNLARQSFISTLRGVFHPRPPYPELRIP